MRKLTLLLLAISLVLFAYPNPALAAEHVHDYSVGTAIEFNGGTQQDDTLTIFTAKPCTSQYIYPARYTTVIVTAFDTLAYQADDTTDDSCLYYVVWCVQPHIPANCIAPSDTGHNRFVRIDSTAAYKRIHTAGSTVKTLAHTPKVFSSPASVMLGEKAFFILAPITKCDSCDVQISYILRQE